MVGPIFFGPLSWHWRRNYHICSAKYSFFGFSGANKQITYSRFVDGLTTHLFGEPHVRWWTLIGEKTLKETKGSEIRFESIRKWILFEEFISWKPLVFPPRTTRYENYDLSINRRAFVYEGISIPYLLVRLRCSNNSGSSFLISTR